MFIGRLNCGIHNLGVSLRGNRDRRFDLRLALLIHKQHAAAFAGPIGFRARLCACGIDPGHRRQHMVAGLNGKYRRDGHIPCGHFKGPPVIVVALYRLNGLIITVGYVQAFERVALRRNHRQRDSFAPDSPGLVRRHGSVRKAIGNGNCMTPRKDQPDVRYFGEVPLAECTILIQAAKLIAGLRCFENRSLRNHDGELAVAGSVNVILRPLQAHDQASALALIAGADAHKAGGVGPAAVDRDIAGRAQLTAADAGAAVSAFGRDAATVDDDFANRLTSASCADARAGTSAGGIDRSGVNRDFAAIAAQSASNAGTVIATDNRDIAAVDDDRAGCIRAVAADARFVL